MTPAGRGILSTRARSASVLGIWYRWNVGLCARRERSCEKDLRWPTCRIKVQKRRQNIEWFKVVRQQSEVGTKDLYWVTNDLTIHAQNFPRHAWAYSVGPKNSHQISLLKQKSPTSFCRSAGKRHDHRQSGSKNTPSFSERSEPILCCLGPVPTVFVKCLLAKPSTLWRKIITYETLLWNNCLDFVFSNFTRNSLKNIWFPKIWAYKMASRFR